VGKNRVKKKKKSLILGKDSGKTPLFSMFNVDSYGKILIFVLQTHLKKRFTNTNSYITHYMKGNVWKTRIGPL